MFEELCTFVPLQRCKMFRFGIFHHIHYFVIEIVNSMWKLPEQIGKQKVETT